MRKEPQSFSHCGSFDQRALQSLNHCRSFFLTYQLKCPYFEVLLYTVGKVPKTPFQRHATCPKKIWNHSHKTKKKILTSFSNCKTRVVKKDYGSFSHSLLRAFYSIGETHCTNLKPLFYVRISLFLPVCVLECTLQWYDDTDKSHNQSKSCWLKGWGAMQGPLPSVGPVPLHHISDEMLYNQHYCTKKDWRKIVYNL